MLYSSFEEKSSSVNHLNNKEDEYSINLKKIQFSKETNKLEDYESYNVNEGYISSMDNNILLRSRSTTLSKFLSLVCFILYSNSL